MLFHFTIIAGTEVLEAEWQFEAGSIDSARASARALLGGLAAERLCTEECEMLW
jgi:hypothetical protein